MFAVGYADIKLLTVNINTGTTTRYESTNIILGMRYLLFKIIINQSIMNLSAYIYQGMANTSTIPY